MKLTIEQTEAISRGEEIPVDVEGTECVLVRRDIYTKISADVSKGHSDEVTAEDFRRLLARSCESSDWNDPAMDIYNDYESVITGTRNHAR